MKIVKKNNPKGIGPAVALFLVAMVVFFEGIILVNFVVKAGDIPHIVEETEIIDAINSVEATKRGLLDAVMYSTNKASKDVLDMGGFCAFDSQDFDEAYCEEGCKIEKEVPTLNCVPWWRIYSDTYAPESWIFKRYLENRIAQKFNEYASLFSVGGAEAPEYCPRPPGVVTVLDVDSQLFIRLSSITGERRNRMIYSGDFFDIIDNATFSDLVGIKTMKIFERGTSLFVSQDSIRKAFNDAENDMPDECKDIYVGDACGNDIKCESRLSNNCANADTTYRTRAEENIDGISGPTDGIRTSVESAGCFEAGHDTDFTYSEKIEEDSSCGCKEWVTECEGTTSPCSELDEDLCGTQDGCSYFKECSGTPNPCSTYNGDPIDCEMYGCIVDELTGDCTGDPANCDSHASEGLCTGAGCTWTAECRGEATPCDDFDDICSGANKADCENSLSNCNLQSGCSGTMNCEERDDLYKDVYCTYDYYGAASVSVEIKNIENKYPIGSSWEELALRFYIVSGNGGQACSATTTEDGVCKTAE